MLGAVDPDARVAVKKAVTRARGGKEVDARVVGELEGGGGVRAHVGEARQGKGDAGERSEGCAGEDGMAGGVVCTLYSPRQGIAMAAVSGLLLALLFLWFRHVHLALPIEGGTLVALWPLWFPPAYYVGAYVYVLFLLHSRR